MGRLDKLLIEKAAGNSRLVRRHDNDEPPAIEQPDSVDAVRKKPDAVEPIEIAHFLNQRAVAIQKHTTLHVGTSLFSGLP
jgi:hypothetical protein